LTFVILNKQVREFRAHTATVNEVSFDADGEYVASCSDDGTVVIGNLYTDEKEKFEYHRPVKAVALDPEFSRKSTRQFASGGLAGQLLFHSKGWLGYREKVTCLLYLTQFVNVVFTWVLFLARKWTYMLLLRTCLTNWRFRFAFLSCWLKMT
jgi:WD40 repeat protein